MLLHVDCSVYFLCIIVGVSFLLSVSDLLVVVLFSSLRRAIFSIAPQPKMTLLATSKSLISLPHFLVAPPCKVVFCLLVSTRKISQAKFLYFLLVYFARPVDLLHLFLSKYDELVLQ